MIMLYAEYADADLGLPLIQAIASVETKDGRFLEGIVVLGSDGFHWSYKTDVFVFARSNGRYDITPLNLEFEKLDLSAYANDDGTLYYGRDEKPTQYGGKAFRIEDSSGKKILTNATWEGERYALTRHMILYQELEPYMYVRRGDNDESAILVDVDKIKEVYLFKNPPKTWTDYIATLQKQWEKDSESAVDYLPPAWYHEVVKDKAEFDMLMKGYEE